MEWPDGEFEAFLRQFQPRKPKPLPTHRRRVIILAIAAVMVAALVIPARYGAKGPSANDSNRTPASTPSDSTNSVGGVRQSGGREMPPGATPNRVPGANATAPDSDSIAARPVNTTSGGANRRLSVGGAVSPPMRVFAVEPAYPENARIAGIEGVIILGIVIGEDGSVIETAVLRSIPELDQAAIDAVRQWQFEPTLLNGEPVEVEMEVTVNFTLR